MNRVAAALLLVTACSGRPGSDEPPPPPLDDVLVIDTFAAAQQNRARRPADFVAPVQTACGTDPSRAFLVELAENNPASFRVPYHWAPVARLASTDRPTVGQPEFLMSGTVRAISLSENDTPFDHVFGYDNSFEVQVDPALADLVYPGQSGGELHVEIDQGLFPEQGFGWRLAAGDRVVGLGAWILDCGHPPYGSELHPPTLLAFARAEGAVTTSLAFANPFRETQLYHPDRELATDFAADWRYGDVDARPFPAHLITELFQVKSGRRLQLDAHALVEPLGFSPLTWYVCAPRTRPAGAMLAASWRFTTRTGVTVDARALDDAGCVRFTATLGADYRPFAPPHESVAWSWDELSLLAADAGHSVDVRQKIIDALGGGDYPALAVDNPPLIDVYTALAPRADAALDAPTAITTGADDQPFPFYGRARVAWR